MELPDWNVEERERGMIDLRKRQIFHFSSIIGSQSLTANDVLKRANGSQIAFWLLLYHFTANDWQSESLLSNQVTAGWPQSSLAHSRGPETFWDPVQLA